MRKKPETPEQTANRRAHERAASARYRARNPEYMKAWRKSDVGKASLKASALKSNTGGAFSLELWNALARLQGNACAICRRPFDALGYRNLHADHCHEEQAPRGLLCRNCNHAEGQIKKTGLSPDEFGRRMALYLSDPPASSVAVPPRNKTVGTSGSKELS